MKKGADSTGKVVQKSRWWFVMRKVRLSR